jgi:predicted TPR repeat methyltransferase
VTRVLKRVAQTLGSGKFDEALRDLLHLSEKYPEAGEIRPQIAEVLLRRGESRARKGKTKEARDDFKRSLPAEQRDAWFACVDPSGVGPRLYFQRVPEGKRVKNRLHLDVRVGTGLVGEERLAALEAECARLVPLGAVHVQTLYDGNDACIPMQDIEGNEFCLD